MALVSSAITYARQLMQTDSNGLTDALGLTFSSDALQDVSRELVLRGCDAAGTIESYTDLTAPTTAGYPATFAWPSDMLSLKTISVNFSGTDPQNYLQATAMDVANIQGRSFEWLRANQPQNVPLFDNRGNTFEIFPTPVVTNPNGIRIFRFVLPTDYSSTSDTIAYPLSLNYRAIGARIAQLTCLFLEDFEQAKVMGEKYQMEVGQLVRILQPASQQPITSQPLSMSGWNF